MAEKKKQDMLDGDVVEINELENFDEEKEWAKNETLKSLERLERIRNNVKKEEIDKENMDLTNPGDMTGDAGGGQFADIDTAVNGMGGEPDELPTEDLELPSNEELSGEAPATPETPAI